MPSKYIGLRQRSDNKLNEKGEIIEPGSWNVNFRPHRGARSIWRTVRATSKAAAYLERAKLIVEASKAPEFNFVEGMARQELTFESIWPAIERNIVTDNVKPDTVAQLKMTYWRIFTDFRLKKYPQVISPAMLTSIFFMEYKSYYHIDLNRATGVREELKRVRSLINRMKKLKFVTPEQYEESKDIDLPPAKKKAIPEITPTRMKELLLAIKIDRPDFYGPIYFMERVGRRVEETLLIERKDIVWDDKLNPVRINIKAESTKMKTLAPLDYLDEDLRNHIRHYYNINSKHKKTNLFLHKKGTKMTQNTLRDYLKVKSKEILGIQLTCHYFRHRFCTVTCNAKLPIVDIMAICGIRETKTILEYYCHSSVEGQASVLEKTKL